MAEKKNINLEDAQMDDELLENVSGGGEEILVFGPCNEKISKKCETCERFMKSCDASYIYFNNYMYHGAFQR